MSRAFVKESESDAVGLPDRAVSPYPNFVTEAGRAAIERTLHRFEAAHQAAIEKGDRHAIAADLREIRYWRARLTSAQVVTPNSATSHVQFATKITIRRDDGREQTFQIVGEDEADPARGTISHASPLARAVMGCAVGETFDIGGGKAVICKIS
jgi:transcription elongation GreA/GreB family factor